MSGSTVQTAANTPAISEPGTITGTAVAGGSSPGTVSALQIVENDLASLFAGIVDKQAGPIAGEVASAYGPEVINILFNSVANLFAHIGAPLSDEMKALGAKLGL
jgi:hypothetical protein